MIATHTNSKWTIKSIKEHLLYLKGINSKKPNNLKNVISFWESQLEKKISRL